MPLPLLLLLPFRLPLPLSSSIPLLHRSRCVFRDILRQRYNYRYYCGKPSRTGTATMVVAATFIDQYRFR